MDIISLVKSRLGDTYDLHRRYINPQFVRVLQVIGFERNYTTAKGAWLKDEKGAEVLDFLAGFGVFNIGRNHPLVARVLKEAHSFPGSAWTTVTKLGIRTAKSA